MDVDVPAAAAAAGDASASSGADRDSREARWEAALGWRWGSDTCEGLGGDGRERLAAASAPVPSPVPGPCAFGACGPSPSFRCRPCKTATGPATGHVVK